MDVDHIIPRTSGGSDEPDNLCLVCKGCNEYKATFQTGIDPVTEKELPLFNPRTQIWSEHFQWSEDGAYIIGLTPVGRATVMRLKMNHEDIVEARRVWVALVCILNMTNPLTIVP